MNTKRIRTAIIDDEARNRTLIAELLKTSGRPFDVCGIAGGVEEGRAVIVETHPDVVFVDIRMGDGTGFDLLSSFGEYKFETVFITAYDEYSLKAFDFNAVDYVLKPVDVHRFEKMLERVELRLSQGSAEPGEGVRELIANQGMMYKIPVHYRDQVLLFAVDEIISLHADKGCTVLNVFGRGSFTSSKQLSDFEFILDRFPFFLKVNKAVYINLNHISSYTKGTYCAVTMANDEVVEISRRQKARILALLDEVKKQDTGR